MGSLSSFVCVWCTPGVAGFVCIRLVLFGCAVLVSALARFRLVRPGAPCGRWVCSDSIWFVRVRPGCRWFFRARLVRPGVAIGVARFVRIGLVRQDAPWGSMVSFAFVCFGRVRLVCLKAH